jgi:peptidoglycan/LPS O-acetylase OafA/YrhL
MRRIQLDYIDGLRALLALYIVAHHIVQFLRVIPRGLMTFAYGQPVVAMFITVSGFCLALPQASSGQWSIDARRFFMRRARRILPPYYAALALAILVSWGFVRMGPFHDPVGEFSFAAIWTHALLIQNWVYLQIYTLDGPLWSIALESQIYLLYPAIVLLRRSWNWYGMLVAAVAFSMTAFHLFHSLGQLHFLLFFVFGVLSAELAFRKRQRWLTVGAIVIPGLVWLLPHLSTLQQETCASLACAGLLAYLSRKEGNIVRRVLSWRPLAWLGTFSYSLYLLHDLFLATAWYWIRNRKPDFANHFDLQFVLFWTVVAVASVALSFGFHVLFERPFMSNQRKITEQRLAAV